MVRVSLGADRYVKLKRNHFIRRATIFRIRVHQHFPLFRPVLTGREIFLQMIKIWRIFLASIHRNSLVETV